MIFQPIHNDHLGDREKWSLVGLCGLVQVKYDIVGMDRPLKKGSGHCVGVAVV